MAARTKFNVDKNVAKRTYNGIVFDSVLEMRYYRDFVLPKLGSGELAKCELQVPYELQEKFKHVNTDGKTVGVRAVTYVADFVLTWSNGVVQVIDTKGMPDATAKLKRKLFWYKYPDIDYQWVTYSKKYASENGGWIEYDKLSKLQRDAKKTKEK
jgi:hypothetical protein|uniref:Endonuclease n=1 Tax=Siphoviridae sp. ct96x5 TaxID=2825367 RepID=A0A8S5PT57_9CAUD|nr:MAG TPA: Endonuclease [Siphoviridae sp. ct96x5]DAO21310.1 MAG TPA: Endonuclease [Caudoviricetes sp.]